jgi:hypothetical protein
MQASPRQRNPSVYLPLDRVSFNQWSDDVDALIGPHRRAMDGQGRTESEARILAAPNTRLEPYTDKDFDK